MLRRLLPLLAILPTLAGCSGNLFGINLFVVGEKTALETQVLGSYQEIGRDLTAYASVRGVNPDGTMRPVPERTPSMAAVLQAFDNRRYNRDDLDVILASGFAGEGRDGYLAKLENPPEGALALPEELRTRVFDEENRDRKTILGRLVSTTPGVNPGDEAEVAWIFATLNQDLAPAGAQLQGRDGAWRVKK